MAEFNEEAVNWIDGVNAADGISAGWRLEIISKKFRKPRKEGEAPKEVPFRIRRFVRGLPWALIHDAIRYLISQAPYTGIIYNGVPIEGTYRPTLTRWIRDDQERVNGNAFGSYTLIQDLIEDEFIDEFSTTTQGNCSEEVVTTWRWDEPAIEDITSLEGYGEQGITYSIQAVRRNEDDLFEYAIVKRIAKTHHSGPVETECNELARTTVESWDNVYGNEDEGFKDETGVLISGIPPECQSEPGVTVQFNVRQNQDCTYQIQLVRKETFEHSVDWTDGTACQSRDVTIIANAKEKPVAPETTVGDSLETQISRNEDMTYSARFAVTHPPAKEVLTWQDGSECKIRDVVQISNSPEKPELPKIQPGQTLNIEMRRNNDCTYSAQFTTINNAEEKVIEWEDGSNCRKRTVKSHQNAKVQPTVPQPEDGQTVNATIRQNDDCTYDAQISVTEAPQEKLIEWTDGNQCVKRRVKSYRNFKIQPEVPTPLPGETVNASVNQNDDCTYDAQISITDPTKPFDKSFTEGSVYEKVEARVFQNLPEIPDLPDLELGESVQVSIRQESDCTYSGSINIAKRDEQSAKWTTGSICSPVTEGRVVNAETYANHIPTANAPGEYVQASVNLRSDGLYDISHAKAIEAEYDTGWLTWTKVARNSTSKTTYKCGLRKVGGYKTAAEVLGLLNFAGDHDLNISVSYNPRTCTYEGTAGYSDWEGTEANGDGAEGGSKSAVKTFVTYGQIVPGISESSSPRQLKITRTYNVVTYYGTGNEGDELQEKANALHVEGIELPNRMYIRSPGPIEAKSEWIEINNEAQP